MNSSYDTISIQHLSKKWDKPVLKDVSLSIPQGQSLVLIGGSGTGKSVLLKCLLGLMLPDAGEIRIEGQDVTFVPTMKRATSLPKTGVLFQGSALFDSLSVAENIFFSLIQRGAMSRRQALDQAVEVLEDVGLNVDVASLRPSQLSGGMQRRVALARAMAERPSLMFFDEPVAGLDPIMSTLISRLIRSSIQKLGATALTITHDLHSAHIIGDRVAMLYEGQIIWQGAMEGLDQASDPRVVQFVKGESSL